MVYDIFISYRRDGGYETAKHINDLLVRDGYSVSFDIDTLREGDFDKALLKRVEECVDFLLIVDKQCFDKTISGSCKPDQDWLRQEVAYALRLKKNIVTVLLAGASFPDYLPDDISEVAKKNGPIYSKGYFDNFYERLKNEFLHALPRNRVMKKTTTDDTHSVACLKLRTDFECLFYLDGEEKMRLKPEKIQKIPLPEGEYELRFVSVDNEADVVTDDFVMPVVDKLYNVSLFDVRLSRIELEEAAEREKRKCEKNVCSIINGHEYIDLGLPSGTLWATCNVGADKPEDYGDYFAWGETKPNTIYNMGSYKYGDISDEVTKYCNDSNRGYDGFVDNLTTLQSSDDSATVNWGSEWRIPTKAEWEELMSNTSNKWVTQNGVKGRLFTSKKNGRAIFLPAAGVRDDEFYGDREFGVYWSSSLYTDDPYFAWYFHFYSDGYDISEGGRDIGQSVRPVCSTRQN